MDAPANQPPNPNPSPADPLIPGAGFKTAGFKVESPVVSPQAATPLPAAPTFPMATGKPKGGPSKSLMVVVVLILVLAGLVVGFGKIRAFISSAQGSCQPENLTESSLTGNSVEILFQTGKACQMEVAYGTSQEALLLQVPEAMASLNHRIRLSPLLASTTYYYQVMSNDKKLGTVRSFLTKAPISPTPASVSPTIEPETLEETTPATVSGRYALPDFQSHFGSSSAEFDLDKNGVVNNADWLLYQRTQ